MLLVSSECMDCLNGFMKNFGGYYCEGIFFVFNKKYYVFVYRNLIKCGCLSKEYIFISGNKIIWVKDWLWISKVYYFKKLEFKFL